MTNEQILNLYKSLKSLKLPGAKFAYAVARNINILDPYVKSLQNAIAMSEDYTNFEKDRWELVKKYAKRDEKKKIVMLDAENVDIDDVKTFDKEVAKLQKEYKKVIADRKTQHKDFEKLLKEEVSVELYKVAHKDIPDAITSDQMSAIFEIID